ncbi:MAG: Rieske 2Fe-2S domain-containing protein, partial [Sciscionella sp.]
MLTAEHNDELTDIAPGTPMGELLRRYWYPVAFTRELNEFPVKPAKLLGEDWAVFKTASGRYGIVPEACPHRRASLSYGVVEPNGIRCPYHGWVFGLDGQCLEQPAERDETNFRERVKANAGVAQELGGLVWAYVGPQPAPLLPRFDVYVMDGVRDIGWADLPC